MQGRAPAGDEHDHPTLVSSEEHFLLKAQAATATNQHALKYVLPHSTPQPCTPHLDSVCKLEELSGRR
jgi:hypothetical protein